MMKVMSTLINIFIFYFLIGNANADVFETQSFSTEGAELICDDKKSDELVLNVYGETFASKIKVIKNKPHNYNINAKFDYYDLPIYEKFRNILSVDYDFYVENNQVIESSLLDSNLRLSIKDIYKSIKQILNEAHENKKCLSWRLE
jgi:CRISPR/Cas system-associated exonuclease Cas4 (RecB family)